MTDSLKAYAKQYSLLIENEINSSWLKGDIAKSIWDSHAEEKAVHGKSSILDEFLEYTNEARSTFNSHRWVSSKFEDENLRYLPGVTWTHYRACAATENPTEWLKRVHDNRWTVARLINEIQTAKEEVEIEDGATCKQCGKKLNKETKVSIKHNKKRAMLCSLNCSIEYCKQLLIDQILKEIDERDEQLGRVNDIISESLGFNESVFSIT